MESGRSGRRPLPLGILPEQPPKKSKRFKDLPIAARVFVVLFIGAVSAVALATLGLLLGLIVRGLEWVW